MFATVEFGGLAGKPAVLVPAEAVIRTGKRNVVIVDSGAGRFAPVEVEIARESGDLAEVRKGLDAGQRVVVSGQFLVDSEASLKGVLARIAAAAQDGGATAAPGAAADPPAGNAKTPAPAGAAK
jgi:Cu(I)/Ag(I) efflux system membrane fusion protein